MFGLHGRVAVVSGGGTGIGGGIAAALSAAGAKVVLVGRRQNVLAKAAAAINNNGGVAATVAADLAQIDNLSQTAKAVVACFGAPTIVVNAAGVNLRSNADPARSAADITIDSWQQTMAINLTAPFFLTRALADGMKTQGGGAVINIGSLQSLRAGLGDAAYGASKGGIAQLTRIMARAWGDDAITVNALLPGFFPSEMTDMVFADAELSARLADSTILGRNGAVADVGGAAVFLASPAAAYITGVLLPVDGGFLAK